MSGSEEFPVWKEAVAARKGRTVPSEPLWTVRDAVGDALDLDLTSTVGQDFVLTARSGSHQVRTVAVYLSMDEIAALYAAARAAEPVR